MATKEASILTEARKRLYIELLYLIYQNALGDLDYPVSLSRYRSNSQAAYLIGKGWLRSRGDIKTDDVVFLTVEGIDQAESWEAKYDLAGRVVVDERHEAELKYTAQAIANEYGGNQDQWMGRSQYCIDWKIKPDDSTKNDNEGYDPDKDNTDRGQGKHENAILDESGPWEQIPDWSYHRKMVELWYKGHTAPYIANVIGQPAKTINNKITKFRKEYGEEIVPYHRKVA